MIGKTISHYKILEKLGEGGMGVVYKAKDTKLDRIVALKFLPRHLLCDSEAKSRFEHEAKAASALDHPNIATIHEIDEVEGECFMAMAYIEGKSLKDLIQEKTFSIEETLDICIQIVEGLNAAHRKGIVHRDIKSDNIMLSDEGLAKIMDFGLAKLKGVSRVTKAGTTLGTVSYMSPEQARGEGVDHRTDIWSLGVVLYEMFTGQLPFKGEYEQAVIYAILNENPKPMADLRIGLPGELEPIVNKALSKSLDSRYQKAEDLLVDLRKLRKELELMASKEESFARKTQPSVAVLPFTNLSPDKEQEYFCDGMAEEIINALTQVEGLRVVARTSAFSFRGREIDIREIGRKLNVETLLEGSVRKAGNRLRITAQLVNVADGYHLWSERFDRDLADVFAIQDEISLAIVDKLKVKLLKEEKARLVKRYTDDPEAYSLYLKGRYFWYRRYEGGLQKGVEYFQQAIDQDPLYALAYAGIADCYNQFGLWGFLHPKEAYPKAKVACAKALEIDDTLAEAYASLGWIKMFYDWDWAEAEKAYKRAIELNPNYATVHYYYGLYLGAVGRGIEAIAEAKKGVELDPLNLVHNAVFGFVFYMQRRYDEAIEQLHKTLEMDPNFAVTCLFLGLSYMGKERWEEAIASLNKFASLWQGIPFPIGFLGFAYGMSEQKDKATSMLDQLSKLSQQRYVSSLYRALIYTGLGKKDQALEYLNKAYDERESWMVSLKVATFMDALRSDPRYEALIKKMGFPR
jgi:serine/threonine protein kinase/Tfp pilus assembly protein PilF